MLKKVTANYTPCPEKMKPLVF